MSGTTTTNLPLAQQADDLIGNSGGNTVRVALSRIAALLSYLQGPAYKTSAELFADKNWPAGAIGQVYGDAAGQNGTYRKSGAAGDGSWTRTGDLVVSPLSAAQLAEVLAAVDAEVAARLAAIRDAGVVGLTNIAGTGDAVTADLPSSYGGEISNDATLVARWPATNAAPDPKITIAGITYTVKGQRGGTVPAGRLAADSPYLLRRHSPATLKIVSALDRSDIGLWAVDNTSDADKPLSAAAIAMRDALRLRAAGATLTAGETADLTSNYYEMRAGATQITATGGRVVGINIPAGQTGAQSFVTPRIDVAARAADLAGYTVRLITVAEISAGMLSAHPLSGAVRVDHQDGRVEISAGILEEEVVSAGHLRRTVLYKMSGTEARIGQVLQIASGSTAASADHSLKVTSLTWQPALDAPDRATSAADLTRALAAESEAARMIGAANLAAPGLQSPRAVTGTVQAAVSQAAGKVNDLGVVQLEAGAYAERSINSDGDIVLRGRGRGRTLLDGSLPDTATATEVANTSVIDAGRGTVVIRDQTVVIANGRYAYHPDNHAANARMLLKNSTFIHRGNIASGWVSQHAVGHGSWSGTSLAIEDCLLSAPRAALQYHNNAAFTHPSRVQVRRSQLVARNLNGYAVLVEPLGSGVQDHLEITDSALTGNIFINCNQWLRPDGYQPASHAAEILVTGAGNTPAVVQVADFGRALRITSATTGSASKVELSGAAVPLLFGGRLYGRDGAAGVAGSRWGDLDINDVVATGPAADIKCGLGPRLGNRGTLGAITLTVRLDGSARTVVFDGDYSTSSNAAVIGVINAAISGLGAASEYAPGNRVRPIFADEEEQLCNTGGTYIHWMAPLCWDASHRSVRIMTDGDPVAAFAGLCWEPDGIFPGEFGRVKRRGWISRQDLIDAGVENGTPAIAYGHWYVPFGTSGKVDADPVLTTYPDGILRVVRADAGQPNTWIALELRGPKGGDGAADQPGLQGPVGPQGPAGPEGPAGPQGKSVTVVQTTTDAAYAAAMAEHAGDPLVLVVRV